MPAKSLDVLTYTRDMESAGLPRPQAEAIAKGVMIMVVEQFDSLVTQEHFDAQAARTGLRFDQVDQRFREIDHRFEQVDQRFEQVDQRFQQIDQRLAHIDSRLDKIEGRLGTLESLKSQVNLHTWMLGLIVIVLVVPQLQRWFAVV
ncbi:MAG: hypothetical protein V7709_18840 [Halioglobus sp.]